MKTMVVIMVVFAAILAVNMFFQKKVLLEKIKGRKRSRPRTNRPQ